MIRLSIILSGLCACAVLPAPQARAQSSIVLNLLEMRVQKCEERKNGENAKILAIPLRAGLLQLDAKGALAKPLRWWPTNEKRYLTYALQSTQAGTCGYFQKGSVVIVQEEWDSRCDSDPDPQACWKKYRAIGSLPQKLQHEIRELAPKPPANRTGTPIADEWRDGEGGLSELQEF